MAGNLLIATNPHRRKGHRTAAQRAASLRNIKKAQRARRGGHSHRRRKNPESIAERRRAAKKGWQRRRRNPETRSERSRAAKLGWRRRRHSHHRSHTRRRNPSRRMFRSGGLIGRQLMPATYGAGGAVVNELGYNFLMGLLPANAVVANFHTGNMRHVGKAITALGLSWVCGMFLRPETAENIGAGALTVVGYNVAKDVLAKVAPNSPQLQLGCADGVGAYVDGYASPGYDAGTLDMRTNPNPQLAAYVESSPGVQIPAQFAQPAGPQLGDGYTSY